MEKDQQAALKYALRILGLRPYTAENLKMKLQKKGFAMEDINCVIDYCKERKYIDDLDYARRWICNSKELRPMGRKRVFQELKMKGIDVELIETGINELLSLEDEEELALKLLHKKFKDCDLNRQNMPKAYSFLVRRGFSYATARKALDTFFGRIGCLSHF
ncbi:regulatory protein RecX [Bacillota bacterium LX-D]|nr:regulatory protein RecX [Bacillota bacterium LX-D]